MIARCKHIRTNIGGKLKRSNKLGTDTTTNEQVAVKIESYCSDPAQLNVESRLYPLLRGGIGIPKMHYYGEESRGRIMVLDLLGRKSSFGNIREKTRN